LPSRGGGLCTNGIGSRSKANSGGKQILVAGGTGSKKKGTIIKPGTPFHARKTGEASMGGDALRKGGLARSGPRGRAKRETRNAGAGVRGLS